MKRENLIIVRAGDDSCHPQWTGGCERSFDLLASYFGKQPDCFRSEADHYHAMVGPRWPAHHDICQNQWDLIRQYEFVAFVCDDIEATAADWDALFATCRDYRLDLAQPAIEGHANYEITMPRDDCLLRITNFVEVMCPIFHRPMLDELRWTFGESTSGWGLNWLWAHALRRSKHRMAVIDSIPVRHGRPTGDGTLYSLLKSQGIDPSGESKAILSKHGVKKIVPRELERVLKSRIPAPKKLLPRLLRDSMRALRWRFGLGRKPFARSPNGVDS